ncbi:hypothetical protein NHG29_03005 [Aerococcaceae bacterium NML160702]|nr:hypothetical protein [Aerococcaceae bacterium NML160702]
MENVILRVGKYDTREFNSIEEAIRFVDQYAYENRLDWYDDKVQRIYNMKKSFLEYTEEEEDEFHKEKDDIQKTMIASGNGLLIIQRYIDEFDLKRHIQII